MFRAELPQPNDIRQQIRDAYRADEEAAVERLIEKARLSPEQTARVQSRAYQLVANVRKADNGKSGIDALLHEYELSSKEGVILMCLAEALLRVPDAVTADKLIQDKLFDADWQSHLGHSDSFFVNASTWGLMLTGKVIKFGKAEKADPGRLLKRMIARSGEPVIRKAFNQAMRIMGRQFVMGRTIDEAAERAKANEEKGYRYSYDMLGEAARTMEDADRYYKAYEDAINDIGRVANGRGPIDSPGISVKLSAIHPRYDFANYDRVMNELTPRLKQLALLAKKYDIGFTVDAEEANRLDLSLDVIGAVFADPELDGWEGYGLAVQAYQKRAYYVLEWLADLSVKVGRKMMVRLVKGAYWDTEVKFSQENGFEGYPCFTRKASTDVSYLACAKLMLSRRDAFYCQFASHNAHTVASILEMAGNDRTFEFQRLHGMGEALYEQIVDKDGENVPCRVYAPVGTHEDLLAYLVRRLLENGANTSFVNRIQDEQLPIEEMIADPIEKMAALPRKTHPKIPAPVDLYGAGRVNSRGIDLTDTNKLLPLNAKLAEFQRKTWSAAPLIDGKLVAGTPIDVVNPAKLGEKVGDLVQATEADVDAAVAVAVKGYEIWNKTPASERANALRRLGDLLEDNMGEFIALCQREAGKLYSDGVAEVREAVDFCRYYANRAEETFREGTVLEGRGVFVCISPWNFPLAIFLGQVTAALAAGNAVIAKPAEQTSLVAARAAELILEAGIPGAAFNLLPGPGRVIGNQLINDPRVAGVAFTGSTETAQVINQALAKRPGVPLPLIAETGGQNAMIVDSTALPEQVVQDAIISGFQSAGQRCSALRVLFVQEDIADKLCHMLVGAMKELRVGDPKFLDIDVGPVIDEKSRKTLDAHAERMKKEAKLLHACDVLPECKEGTFFAPHCFEIPSLDVLEREVFGPVVHVIRYKARDLDKVLDQINASGYGLTMGIHSRIDGTVRQISQKLRVGNCYVNRNMIGAVVGVQPFGGQGKSGTGPKAGGPHYVERFAKPIAVTGNADQEAGFDDRSPIIVKDVIPSDEYAAMLGAQESWQAVDGNERVRILEKLAAKLTASGKAELVAGAHHIANFAAVSENGFVAPKRMPGPTGETNDLYCLGRGVYLVQVDKDAEPARVIRHLGAALAAGNAVILAGDQKWLGEIPALVIDAGLPDKLVKSVGTNTGLGAMYDGAIAGVSCVAPLDRVTAFKQLLAKRDGAILSLISDSGAEDDGALPDEAFLHRFATEKTITINTTAAGGNASLMSMDEN
ncbi:bifunctional proline dehydrogenase/L-glutamate gamma-semialdehyde dehydrogenase PutA [Thalassospira sp. GO-4]|jgi:RHH-type proline utilization regulon transcriptional repressor/proline dehydrogenase/delta 1-pyrroline-5-carboxylate dehydrogenase|uniref:bifunctional proline dehydrogenase/L-glutamate gamma-semialdehyde dehydrogenase PutA n=1 Tax=Thalassospira sp. GO-4 TaxID=2946605 RepID=UPI00202440E3|nr:bifunctional proline dehydrogenase/L-glutamate gamma-semialdehyde dehydrogenase PutA [Thalassospira sp. GO-4]URK19160.1 bifunctional proline dehydrogenase/L-glutamate gamma-semialdehyde dehydrogenase PutA [Thalassospira sp. GO-4]